MGIACTRPLERVAAALGLLDGAPTEFQVCRDVSFGGVLCALPALTQNGLFDHLDECFPSLGGYYTTTQIVSVLALMALCRIQTVEQLQYQSPGELGKLLGLDHECVVWIERPTKLKSVLSNISTRWASPSFIDQGLLEALESDIVPRLLEDIPDQPTPEQLAADPYLHRFVMVFDREGYTKFLANRGEIGRSRLPRC